MRDRSSGIYVTSLTGRVAVVTGGGSGIGRATARELSARGAKVVVSGRRADPLEETVALIRGDGGEALAVPGDIGNEKDVMGLIRAAKDTFGALDIAVNNAAIEGTLEQMTELSHKDFAATLETNVVGTFLCLKYELAAMGDGGAIVNVSSVNAVRAEPTAAAYCASKAAVESLTKTAALEAGPRGIRVNALRAGFFLTAMHDRSLEAAGGASPQLIEEVEGLVALRRRGDPREAAGTIAWLCSDDASYVTGSVVTADGGLTAT